VQILDVATHGTTLPHRGCSGISGDIAPLTHRAAGE
jgi:hypothetical protein